MLAIYSQLHSRMAYLNKNLVKEVVQINGYLLRKTIAYYKQISSKLIWNICHFMSQLLSLIFLHFYSINAHNLVLLRQTMTSQIKCLIHIKVCAYKLLA